MSSSLENEVEFEGLVVDYIAGGRDVGIICLQSSVVVGRVGGG